MIRTKDIEIGDKIFVVSQMPLIQGDRWANRVALALCKSGVDVSGITVTNGFKGLLDITGVINVALKALGGVDDDIAQGLLDELINTVRLKLPDGSSRPLIVESDIQDIKALWKLRIEAIKINLDFLTAGVIQ